MYMQGSLELGERKTVEIVKDVCDMCETIAICIECDNSQWEYMPIVLCLQCIQDLFKRADKGLAKLENAK